MGWMGKIVGGTIGLALGGPLGAIAGAAFGHFFDQTNEMARRSGTQGPRLSTHEDAQMTFFVAAFSMLAKLVQADGRVTQDEIASIERFMRDDLRLSPPSRQVAINIFNTAKTSPHAFEDFALQFYQAFRNRPEILAFMLDILVRVALADHDFSTTEAELVRRAARNIRAARARRFGPGRSPGVGGRPFLPHFGRNTGGFGRGDQKTLPEPGQGIPSRPHRRQRIAGRIHRFCREQVSRNPGGL